MDAAALDKKLDEKIEARAEAAKTKKELKKEKAAKAQAEKVQLLATSPHCDSTAHSYTPPPTTTILLRMLQRSDLTASHARSVVGVRWRRKTRSCWPKLSAKHPTMPLLQVSPFAHKRSHSS